MNRSGQMVMNLKGEMAYESFRPAPLPPQPSLEIDDHLNALLIQSNIDLAKLSAVADLIPDEDLFISMYVRKEALISSQIEGTQCTLDDILDPVGAANSNLDVVDVINYVNALRFAIDRMNTLPLCCRLLREIHQVLMAGVRGEEKNPGEFRRSQNWIGPANCTLKEARYIPPNVTDMDQAMSDLEKYMNEDGSYDPLIQAALIHYQFETIHPFLDGNGRIGRLLILLYLMDRGKINKPVLYVSYFLKKNQLEYYDRIGEVRRSGHYEQWVRFFLEAVDRAAEDALNSIYKLKALHDENMRKLPKTGRSKAVIKLFQYVEQHPIIDISKTAKDLDLSYNTVSTAVQKLVAAGILKETTNAARNKVFAYENYLDILREGTERI